MENIYNAIQNVYNMDKTTWQEVLAELYNLVSKVENKFDSFENKFGVLLGEEVTIELKKMYDDGSLTSLFNDKLLKDINRIVDTLVSEQLDTKANKGEVIQYINSEIAKAQIEGVDVDTSNFTTNYDMTKLGRFINTTLETLEGGYDLSFNVVEKDTRCRTIKFFLKKGDFITISNKAYVFRPITVERHFKNDGVEINKVFEVIEDTSEWLEGKFIAEKTSMYAIVLKKNNDTTVNISDVKVVVNNREDLINHFDLECIANRLNHSYFNPETHGLLSFSEVLDTVVIEDFDGNTLSCNHAYSKSNTKTLFFLHDEKIISSFYHNDINSVKQYKIPYDCNKIIICFNRNIDIKLEIYNQNYSYEYENNEVIVEPKFFVSKTEKEKMSHGTELIVDNGVGYVAYLCSETSTVEQPSDSSIMCRLSLFDICGNSREIYDVAKANDIIDGITIDNSSVYEPNIIDDGININYMLMAKIKGVNTYCNYKFNKSKKIFSNFEKMKLIYNSKEYDFNSNNVKNILDNLTDKSTDCHHLVFTGRIQKFNGLYYGVLCGTVGSIFDGLILTSTDLVKWEVKKSLIELNLSYVSECELIIDDNEITLLARDNNRGIFLGRYNALNFNFINVTKLQSSIASRPQIFTHNNNKYIMYNIDAPVYVEGYGSVVRNTAHLYKYKNGELIFVKKYKSLDGFHYYSIVSYKNKLLCVYSTDYKRLDCTQTRSSLGYCELEI